MCIKNERKRKKDRAEKAPENYTINFRMMIVISEVERMKKGEKLH